MNKTNILFQIFLIAVFLAGIYFLIKTDGYNKYVFEGMQMIDDEPSNATITINDDKTITLQNNDTQDTLVFNSLDEYNNYIGSQVEFNYPDITSQYYEKSSVDQSDSVNPDDAGAELAYYNETEPNYTSMPTKIDKDYQNNKQYRKSEINEDDEHEATEYEEKYNSAKSFFTSPPVQNKNESPTERNVNTYIDASRENQPFNKNNYSGFDPTGLNIGKYDELDAIHDSTEEEEISDNPMDPNWGGVMYTQKMIDTGKYEDYNITRPLLFNPKVAFTPIKNNGFALPKDVI